jgi:chromosome partitioning protein
MTRIMAAVSQKGGVGKTSLIQNLGAELATLGRRVLMVDFDPQSNLTMAWGLNPRESRPTVYQAMLEPTAVTEAILPIRPGLDLLPASLDLAGAEDEFNQKRHVKERYLKLKQALAAVAKRYDVILIDAPPSLGYFTISALLAATEVIVPLQVQGFAYKALDQLLEIIDQARESNPQLRINGIALTMYDGRLALTNSVEGVTRRRFAEMVYQTTIPNNVRIAEASLQGTNVAEFEAGSRGAIAYRALAQEVLARG